MILHRARLHGSDVMESKIGVSRQGVSHPAGFQHCTSRRVGDDPPYRRGNDQDFGATEFITSRKSLSSISTRLLLSGKRPAFTSAIYSLKAPVRSRCKRRCSSAKLR